MGEKINKVKGKVAYGLDLPTDIVLGLPKITLIGKDELTIENHKGILKFENCEIAINTSIGVLDIKGSDFEIILVGGTTITVRGKVSSMVYEDNE